MTDGGGGGRAHFGLKKKKVSTFWEKYCLASRESQSAAGLLCKQQTDPKGYQVNFYFFYIGFCFVAIPAPWSVWLGCLYYIAW
jgi:hypothetical protein